MEKLERGEYDPKMPTYRYTTEEEFFEASKKLRILRLQIIKQIRELNKDLDTTELSEKEIGPMRTPTAEEQKYFDVINLAYEVFDLLFIRFFDFQSMEMLDEKLEVLKALKNGKRYDEIPNFYKVLENYPTDNSVSWDL